jgi:hypothetical protein
LARCFPSISSHPDWGSSSNQVLFLVGYAHLAKAIMHVIGPPTDAPDEIEDAINAKLEGFG